MSAPFAEIAPEVRADLDAGAAEAGYTIRSIDEFTFLPPGIPVPGADHLGAKGYFGFAGHAISVDGGEIQFGCLWEIDKEGDRYRIVKPDEEMMPAQKGWLPDPTRAVVEGPGRPWRLHYDVSRETVS